MVVRAGDFFLTKINADGSYGYGHRWGSTSFEESNYIAIDGAGNIYVAGYFRLTVDFDPTAGTDNHTSQNSSEDAFVTRLNADGSYEYTYTWGGDYYDRGEGVIFKSDDTMYLLGEFADVNVDLDPTGGTFLRDSDSGSTDIVLIEMAQ